MRCCRPSVTGLVCCHSCSENCACVGGVESQQFRLVVGLQQGYVLNPLFFIVYMICVDPHSRVDGGTTIWTCRIHILHFVDDLVLLASSQ